MKKLEFRKPIGPFIYQGEETKKLYHLEDERNKYINLAAKELQKVLCLSDYWTEAMPEALFSVLDSFEVGAAEAAAEAYLEKRRNLKAQNRG